MTKTLTSASPTASFQATPGALKHLATSGTIGAGAAAIKVQHRVLETDDWVDRNVTVTPDGHIDLAVTVRATYNRVVVTDPDGTTSINLSL